MTKNFLFAEGVYMDFEEFQSNTPAYTFDEVNMYLHTNPQNYLTQVQHIFKKENGEEISMDSVWGICIEGIPFVQLPPGSVKKELPVFAALKLRGKICYYTYPDWQMKKIPIAAYNPVTGYPFLRSTVEREEQVKHEKILNFETGEIKDFTVDNFLEWIQDDKNLLETIGGLSSTEKEEKLFKCLLIYVDRNLTQIKNRGEEDN